MGIAKGIAKGIAEGRAEGEAKERSQTIERMKALGMTEEQIRAIYSGI